MIILYLLTLATIAIAEQRVLGSFTDIPFTDALLTNVNRRDGCLGIHDWSFDNGTKLTLHERYWGTNQLWSMGREGQIYVKHSNKCMSLAGSDIVQDMCDGSSLQKWKYDSDTKRIIHTLSNKCIGLPGDSSNDVQPRLVQCDDGWEQQWVPTVSYLLSRGYKRTLVQGSRLEFTRLLYSLELEQGRLALYNVSTNKIVWNGGNSNSSECMLSMFDTDVSYVCGSEKQVVWKESNVADEYPCEPPRCVNANYTLYVSPYEGLMHVRHGQDGTVTLWASGLGGEDYPSYRHGDSREWCLCKLSISDNIPVEIGCEMSMTVAEPWKGECKKLPQ